MNHVWVWYDDVVRSLGIPYHFNFALLSQKYLVLITYVCNSTKLFYIKTVYLIIPKMNDIVMSYA